MNDQLDNEIVEDDTEGHMPRMRSMAPVPSPVVDEEDTEGHGRRAPAPSLIDEEDTEGHGRRAP